MKHSDFADIQADSSTQENFFSAFTDSKRSPGKILLKIYRGNYLVLLKSLLFNILQITPVLLIPILNAKIINIAAYPNDYPIKDSFKYLIILAVVISQNILSTYYSSKYRSIANRRVELNLRSSMARKLQQLSITFHKEMRSGRIQSKVMRDVENVEGLTNTLIVNGTQILFSLITAIIVTLCKSPMMFLFYLVIVPTALIILMGFRKKIRDNNTNYRRHMENASAQVMEMVEMIPVTKAHALEETSINRMNKQLNNIAGAAHRLDRVTALFNSTYWVVFRLFSLGCLAFTAYLAYKGKILAGDITLYTSYFGTITDSIASIINMFPIVSRGFESVNSIGEIMSAMDIEDDEDKEPLKKLEGKYEFENVHFHYADDPKPVLNGLNLTINKGETIAFVGESGSGKSTMLNMLIGFYRPTSGRVLIDGTDMAKINLHSYRMHIATVPQTPVLFSGSIRDNITFGMETYTQEQLDEAIRIANLEDVIAKLPQGLETSVGEHGDKLSGGQRQRIAIARAVIRNPSVFIFDEATSALDTISEKLIQDSIEKLSHNRTTFVVAHRLSTIRNADKIAVIKNGICAEYGTWDELINKKGEFYRFRNMQT